ncbi:MAG: hypothetical protein WCO98_08550 [bacterium]
MIETVEYGGWKNNIKLSNGSIELIATLDVGPRIISFSPIGGPNVMKNYPDQIGKSGEDEWQIRGGHRLWHAPEAKPRTYSLDNSPIKWEKLDDFSVKLISNPEPENGIQKEIELIMDSEANVVTVIHRTSNTGNWAIELAAWALTVMDAGGICIVPLPPKRSHTEVLVPDFPLVLWPYTDMSDPRFRWGKKYFTFSQDSTKSPAKFGMAVKDGWAAYLVKNTLFMKYFDYDPYEQYPDFGCNFETFSNEEMLEVESLGPVIVLDPGETYEHVETWKLVANIPAVSSDEDIDKVILPQIG